MPEGILGTYDELLVDVFQWETAQTNDVNVHGTPNLGIRHYPENKD